MSDEREETPGFSRADEKQRETEDCPPVVEVTGHSVEILHRGHDRTTGEGDICYRFVFEDGEVVAILQWDRLGESNEFDPRGPAVPSEVPSNVKGLLEREMEVDNWVTVVDVEQVQEFAGGSSR